MVCLFAPNKDWVSEIIDVKTAFLQGEPLTRDVHIIPPKEWQDTCIYRLKKGIYGLLDASRHWYNRVRRELLSAGCNISKVDSSLFYHKVNDRLHGLVCIHVDDVWFAGDNFFYQNVVSKVCDVFNIGSRSFLPYRYLGLLVSRTDGGIILEIPDGFENLHEVEIEDLSNRSKNGCTTLSEQESMRSVLGKLQWLAVQIKPEIAFQQHILWVALRKAQFQI